MFYKNIVFKEDSSFVFQASRANHLIMRLFVASDYEKLMENDMEAVLATLSEKKYDTSEKNKEEMLKKEEKKLFATVLELTKEKAELKDYFLLPFDILNFKILYKGLLKQEKWENLKLFSLGTVENSQLKKFYEGEEIGQIHPDLTYFLKKYEEEITEQNPFESDLLWDKYLFSFFLKKALALKSDYLLKIHSLKIDMTNLLNLFRLKSFDKDYRLFEKAFIPGGQLSLYLLSDLYKEENEVILGKIFYLDYIDALKKGMESFRKTGSLSEMEKEMENYYLSYLGQARHKIFGYESIILYYWLKMNEISNLRLILTARENKIQKEWVLSRLRV